ncbi:Cdc4p, partial [Saccharomyces cerevisiae YJM1202]|jgi:hypothetical protein
LI